MRPEDSARLRELVRCDRAPTEDERVWLLELVRKASRLSTLDWVLARIEAQMVLGRGATT